MKQYQFNWEEVTDFLIILGGVFLQALGMRLFFIPAHLASGGVAGLSQVVNFYTHFPIGIMVILGNIPLFILGWRYLGGFRFALRTIFAVVFFSIFVDGLSLILPADGLIHDLNLNALYGGVISGIGYGLVYRGKGTSGGSDILGRILNHWRGISISQSYLLTDAGIMLLAGLAFSWENALYAIVSLYISGLAAEAALEGSNVVRTVMIITDKQEEIRLKILNDLERGVTIIPAVGGYSGSAKSILYCVLSRSEISQIKAMVRQLDPAAFVVIGQAHEALGEGFKRFE